MSFKNSLFEFYLIMVSLMIFLVSCVKNDDILITEKPLVYGYLSAIKNQEKLISGGDTLLIINNITQAHFFADPNVISVFTDAGIVSLNDSTLIKDSNNQYLKIAKDLKFNNAIHWNVSGVGNIPSFTYDDSLYFPSYTDNLPSFVDKSAGLIFLLDTTTVKGADSVRIYIDDGGNNIVQKTFSGKAGNIQISSADLAPLNTVNNKTAYLGIYAYTGKLKAIFNKGFYFIREGRKGQSVNIY